MTADKDRLILGLVGYSRCGKDTCAEWLRDHTCLNYSASMSRVALPYMAKKLGLNLFEAWETRHKRRDAWFTELNRLRHRSPTVLVRMCRTENDIICGLRNDVELEAARRQDLIDLVLWIDRPGTPVDPTVEFTSSSADLVVENSGTLAELYLKLRRLAAALKILRC